MRRETTETLVALVALVTFFALAMQDAPWWGLILPGAVAYATTFRLL